MSNALLYIVVVWANSLIVRIQDKASGNRVGLYPTGPKYGQPYRVAGQPKKAALHNMWYKIDFFERGATA